MKPSDRTQLEERVKAVGESLAQLRTQNFIYLRDRGLVSGVAVGVDDPRARIRFLPTQGFG
jgi:hypothetical protein